MELERKVQYISAFTNAWCIMLLQVNIVVHQHAVKLILIPLLKSKRLEVYFT